MKALATTLLLSFCLLSPALGTAADSDLSTPSVSKTRINNVWKKIRGQWDHNGKMILIKKQILFSINQKDETRLKETLMKLPFLTVGIKNN